MGEGWNPRRNASVGRRDREQTVKVKPGEEVMADRPSKDIDPEVRAAKGSMYIAAVSAVISLLAIGAAVLIGLVQVHLVGQQNNNAQQQELTTLVTDISQGQQAASTSNTEGTNLSPELTVLAEAEEANNIIDGLPSSDVSSVERYVVGQGLEDGDDYQLAIQLLTEAAQEKTDPRTTADAWRGAAAAWYALGSDKQAESDINQARVSFNIFGVTIFSRASNIAFTDLFDIFYRAPIDCSAALNEWDQAAQLTQADHYILNNGNSSGDYRNDVKALKDSCHVAADTLNVIYIAGSIPPQP